MNNEDIGRIVHYVSYGTPNGEYTSKCRAAVITEVGCWITTDTEVHDHGDAGKARTLTQVWYREACALAVLNPTGQFFNECKHDAGDKVGGTWHEINECGA